MQCEMQSVSSRIRTRVVVSISYDDNHYTTGTTMKVLLTFKKHFDFTVMSLHLDIPLMMSASNIRRFL